MIILAIIFVCVCVCFHTNFKIISSSLVKNVIGILIGIALHLYIVLGSMANLTRLILPTQECDIYFHYFVSFSIYSISVLQLLECRSFATLGVFIFRFTYVCFCSVAQSHPNLCGPMNCSLPSSTVHGIFQARILEWLPFPAPGVLPNSGIESASPHWLEDSLSLVPPEKLCSVLCLVTQSCPILCDRMDCSPPGFSVHGDSPGKNIGVGCHALLPGKS